MALNSTIIPGNCCEWKWPFCAALWSIIPRLRSDLYALHSFPIGAVLRDKQPSIPQALRSGTAVLFELRLCFSGLVPRLIYIFVYLFNIPHALQLTAMRLWLFWFVIFKNRFIPQEFYTCILIRSTLYVPIQLLPDIPLHPLLTSRHPLFLFSFSL